MRKPIIYYDDKDLLINVAFSNLELNYLSNLIFNDPNISDITKRSLSEKINYLSERNTEKMGESDKSLRYLINNHETSAGPFNFWFNHIQNEIEYSDNETGDYANDGIYYYDSLDDFMHNMYSKDIQDEEVDKYQEHVRICSICGKPIDTGYTDECDYICSDSEFGLYMDDLYGVDNWRPATMEEVNKYEASYMYREPGEEQWKSSPWYITEWYDNK